MQDFGTKADNSAPPGGQLSAAEFNNLATENKNAVLRSGQSLSGSSDVQLATSMFLHGVKSKSFQDSGAANAYVATPVSGTNGVLLPADYTNLAGTIISFKASNANTGASTLNIGQTTGTLLGTKAIRTQTDTALHVGAISAGQYIQLVYNPAFVAGAGAWELLPWAYSQVSPPPSALNTKMSVAAASATATITADSVTVNTTIGGAAFRIAPFSRALNLATTGVGGMDTGTAPVNGYVAIYAIYNPTTGVATAVMTNATSALQPEIYGGANMPSGFTFSALIGVWPTNASSQFKTGLQRGRNLGFVGVTVLSSSAIVTGASLSISTALPINASRCGGAVSVTSTVASGTSLTVYSDTALSGRQIVSNTNAEGTAGNFFVDISTAQSIIYTTANSAGTPTFTVSISSYQF